MTLQQLKSVARFICPVWVTRNNQKVAVADIFKEYNPDGPDTWYVWEYDTNEVKRLQDTQS